jgi:hypothetical protein
METVAIRQCLAVLTTVFRFGRPVFLELSCQQNEQTEVNYTDEHNTDNRLQILTHARASFDDVIPNASSCA